ncbi:unnamed protein product [Periconia digitata]|uniref:Uncharacterized protein n=1 Tax=Periconia digitata TaxID=1303443 RepID=A0A9W4XQ69_9PLEO|nr:unnamed protein product [Periconia digitata]
MPSFSHAHALKQNDTLSPRGVKLGSEAWAKLLRALRCASAAQPALATDDPPPRPYSLTRFLPTVQNEASFGISSILCSMSTILHCQRDIVGPPFLLLCNLFLSSLSLFGTPCMPMYMYMQLHTDAYVGTYT